MTFKDSSIYYTFARYVLSTQFSLLQPRAEEKSVDEHELLYYIEKQLLEMTVTHQNQNKRYFVF